MFVDYDVRQINKLGEEVCGDGIQYVESTTAKILVLSDGLGSGIKANILSTITKVIISKLLVNDVEIEEVIDTLASTLPVCKERKMAYSTFSVLKFFNDGFVDIIEFDNPYLFYFRNSKLVSINRETIVKSDKTLYCSKIKAQRGDVIVVVSDGVTNAGCNESVSFGWGWNRVSEYLEKSLKEGADIHDLVQNVAFYASELNKNMPSDDITVLAVHIRDKRVLNIAIGPPSKKEQDISMANNFLSLPGRKIICGGTTAKIIAKSLNKKVEVVQNSARGKLPSKLRIDGINLVTEGMLTLSQVLENFDNVNPNVYKERSKTNLHDIFKVYTRNNIFQNIQEKIPEKFKYIPRDQVEELILELKQSDEINCYIGKAENAAYLQKGFNLDITRKFRIIEDLKKKLEKMSKKICVEYF